MGKVVTKREFLARAIGLGEGGARMQPLLINDAFVRDNARIACQALHFKLIRLRQNTLGLGFEIVATAAGRLLYDDRVEEAAKSVEGDRTPPVPVRNAGEGVLVERMLTGTRMPLEGTTVRQHAAEALCAIASGSLVVSGEYLRVPYEEVGRRIGTTPRERSYGAVATVRR